MYKSIGRSNFSGFCWDRLGFFNSYVLHLCNHNTDITFNFYCQFNCRAYILSLILKLTLIQNNKLFRSSWYSSEVELVLGYVEVQLKMREQLSDREGTCPVWCADHNQDFPQFIISKSYCKLIYHFKELRQVDDRTVSKMSVLIQKKHLKNVDFWLKVWSLGKKFNLFMSCQ